MFLKENPFFMTNDEWYYFDGEDSCVKLTDKAPELARKDYEEFMGKHGNAVNSIFKGILTFSERMIDDYSPEELELLGIGDLTPEQKKEVCKKCGIEYRE